MLEITEKMSDVTAQDALKNLSSYLNLLYGKKVLIFLDAVSYTHLNVELMCV